jgi:hypothetical protein
MRRRFWIALLLFGASPAACSSDGERPAAAGSDGSAGKLNGIGGKPSEGEGEGGSADSAPGGTDQGTGGEEPFGHLGGLGPVNSGGGGVPAAALCDVAATWGDAQPLSGISGGADERLLAMTHDELSIVFTRDDALMVADRASSSAGFDPPIALTLPAGYSHRHGVTLSSDGLRLVLVSDTGAGFAEVTRSSRQGAFGSAPSSARFSALNYDANQFGAELSSPVLSNDDRSLYFVRLTGDASLVYHALGETTFAVPEMSEDMVTLGGHEGDAKLTQSVSADERSLFIHDAALGHVSGLWSSAPGAPFTEPAHFPGFESVFTNHDCTRLYGTRKLEDARDIVVATPN